MERYEEEGEDSDNETDPEQLLNEWLGELDSLTVVSFCLADCAMIATQSWKRLRFDEMSMVTKIGVGNSLPSPRPVHIVVEARRSIGVNWRVI